MKSWAEAVLADEAEPPRVEASRPEPEPVPPRPAEPARAAGPASPVAAPHGTPGPPEHWLRDIQARGGGPPSDWVARVRRGAPQWFDNLVREGLVAPEPEEAASSAATPPAPVSVKGTRLAPPRTSSASGQEAHGPMREVSPLGLQVSSSPGAPEAVRPPSWGAGANLGSQGETRGAEVAPRQPGVAPGSLDGMRRDIEVGPGSLDGMRRDTEVGQGSLEGARPGPWGIEVAPGSREGARPGAWGAEVAPGSPVRPASWGPGLERPVSPGSRPVPTRNTVSLVPPSARAHTLPPVERSSGDGAAVHVLTPVPRALPPWEASASRKAPGPSVQLLSIEGESVSRPRSSVSLDAMHGREPGGEAAPAEAFRPHPWPELPPAPSSPSEPLAWPELPPAPAAEPMGVLVELREWERLRRLEREQRGE